MRARSLICAVRALVPKVSRKSYGADTLDISWYSDAKLLTQESHTSEYLCANIITFSAPLGIHVW